MHRSLAQQAETRVLSECDPAELRAGDAGNTVVASQTVIQECIVGGQEFDNASVFREEAADEGFRFRRKIVPQLLVECGEQLRVGGDLIESREIQPLHGETGDQAGSPGIGEHASHLFLQT